MNWLIYRSLLKLPSLFRASTAWICAALVSVRPSYRVIEAMVPPPPGVMLLTMTSSGTGWTSTTSCRVCESAGVMMTSSSRP
ncbi:hypothetical protein D3C78_1370760 [compost metagenome]